MGELEYHDKKVAEALEQGKEEGRKEGGGGNGDGSLGFLLVMIIFFIGIIYFNPEGVQNKRTSTERPQYTAQSKSLPADISNYISPDAVRFYKYVGSGGEVYIRHHYEPTEQISKQGYYRSDTNEYILVDISYYIDNGQNYCRWSIYYCNGGRTTLASDTDPVDVIGVSSYNCQSALTHYLSAYDFDPITYNDNGYYGDDIGRDEALSIIGYSR